MSRENDEVGGDGVNSSHDSPSFNPLATPTLGKVAQVESDRLDSVSSDADARTLSNGNQDSESKQQVASEGYAKHRVAPVTDSVSAEHQGKSTGSLPGLGSRQASEGISSGHPKATKGISPGRLEQDAGHIVPSPPEPHSFLDEAVSLKQKAVQPNDARGFLRFIMFIQGLASLLPWNSVLIMIFGFDKYASEAILGFSLASFVFSWLVSFHGSKISPSRNAFFSIIIVTIVLVGLTGMVLLSLINLKNLKKTYGTDLDKWKGLDWRVTWWYRSICIILLLGMSLCGAIGNNGFYGMLPNFAGSGQLIQAYSSGQGISGFITAIISYCIVQFLPSSPGACDQVIEKVSKTFWVLFAQIIVPILGFFLYVGPFIRSSEYQQYLKNEQTEKSSRKSEDDVEGKHKSSRQTSQNSGIFQRAFIQGIKYELSVFFILTVTLIILNNPKLKSGSSDILGPPTGFRAYYLELDNQDDPTKSGSKNRDCIFKVPALMLAYQFGDWVSRFFPLWSRLNVSSPNVLLASSLLRWVLVIWLVVRPTLIKAGINHWILAWLTQDWIALFMFLVTGLTNGYFCLLSMIHASSACKDRQLIGPLSALMPLFLFLGIFIGSVVGYVLYNYILN